MRVRRIASIFFASLAAYALSFAFDLLFGALLGSYPNTAFLPSVTWTLLGGIGIWTASALWKSKWLAVPYAIFGLLAGLSSIIASPLLNLLVASVMLLAAYFLWRPNPDTSSVTSRPITDQSSTLLGFPTEDYALDGPVPHGDGLAEFSALEYALIERQFKNQLNYNAPAVRFLDMTWSVMLGTVEGRIYKIAASQESLTQEGAESLMAIARGHCYDRFGIPDASAPNLTVWKMTGGNVVVQALGLAGHWTVNLFVTSSASRVFEQL